MKNLLFILAIILSIKGYSQTTYRIIPATSYSASASFTYYPTNGRIGSIQIATSSSFSGTTGTIALQGSNDDGSNWSTIYANDGTTPLSVTLTSGNNTYVWELQSVMYQAYRIVYTKGDSSAGTISATITTR